MTLPAATNVSQPPRLKSEGLRNPPVGTKKPGFLPLRTRTHALGRQRGKSTSVDKPGAGTQLVHTSADLDRQAFTKRAAWVSSSEILQKVAVLRPGRVRQPLDGLGQGGFPVGH